MTLDEMIEVLQAAKAGKKIEAPQNPCWSIDAWLRNQNIRIKPEPRVIYVNEYPDGLAGGNYPTEEKANISAGGERLNCVKFIEVLE